MSTSKHEGHNKKEYMNMIYSSDSVDNLRIPANSKNPDKVRILTLFHHIRDLMQNSDFLQFSQIWSS